MTQNKPPKALKASSIAVILLIIALAMISGCAAVGPDYRTPDTQAPQNWHTPLDNGLKGKMTDPQTLAEWWTTLNDAVLNDLIRKAIAGNLDLKDARARVREARANRHISRAELFPGIDATGSFKKSQSSETSGGGIETDLSSVGFDASWELDLFGGIRRSVEAATADLEASREDLHDVLVSLLAEVALNYIDVRTYQSRLDAAEGNLKAQQETFRLTELRCQAGLTTELAVQQAKYNMESTRAEIPALKAGLDEAMNNVAVLLGKQPGAAHAQLSDAAPIPIIPKQVAVGVPAEALRHRPDVRRSERELAAQTARVGVAVADLYPKLSLTGTIGLESLSLSDLVSAGSRTYSFGPSITWPVFNAGAIRSEIEVQSALQEQALVQYETTVLGALKEVENSLMAYTQEQSRTKALREATEAARQAALLAEQQYNAGLIEFTDVLDAQRSLLSFQDQLAQSEGTAVGNVVRLYKALGGGWTSHTSAGARNRVEGRDSTS